MKIFYSGIFTLLLLLFGGIEIASAQPTGLRTFYIAPNGNDNNSGTEASPFATLNHAVDIARAGDVFIMRGGNYTHSSTIQVPSSRSGTANNPVIVIAYPGETPVLDFSSQPKASNNNGIRHYANYWQIIGITIKEAGHNGIRMDGSHNILERMTAYGCHDTGIHMAGGASHNLVKNCDSYHNFNTTGNVGNNADGFSAKFDIGPGNHFYGCRSWENSDDGFDLWRAQSTIIIENCWVFGNGDASVFGNPDGFRGNGNGIKLGGDGVPGDHIVIRNLSFDNKDKGFDHNNNSGALTLKHNTAYNNGRNYYFPNDPADGSKRHIYQNNLSAVSNVLASLSPNAIEEGNSWQSGQMVTTGMFESVNTALAKSPRQADGSLPDIDLLKPKPGSFLINGGVDIGEPFYGSAPDIGAYELGGAVSGNATLSQLTIDGEALVGFDPNTTSYTIELDQNEIPVVGATAASGATYSITQATSIPGEATVLVTAEDGVTQNTYTISFTREADCAGISGGTAFIDNCGNCVGNTGNTGCLTFIDGPEACAYEGVVETQHEGFYGEGFLNGDNKIGNTILYSIYAESATTTTIAFRHANGAGDNRNMELRINGTTQIASVDFHPTGAWSSWESVFVTIELNQGSNTLELVSLTNGGGPNFDLVALYDEGVLPGSCGTDCHGDTGGSASIDECGECTGGNTGLEPNASCEMDCNGEWGGEAFIDDCGECVGGQTGETANSSCEQDCHGEWGGTAFIDDCEVCVGGNTGIEANTCPTTFIFTNNSGDRLWNNPLNWDPERVPGAGDTAIIQGGELLTPDGIVATILRVGENGNIRIMNEREIQTIRLEGGELRLITGGSEASLTSNIEVLSDSRIQSRTEQAFLTIYGTISGSANLQTLGSGEIILVNDGSEYSGNWDITEGTVRVANSSALGSGEVQVHLGASLSIEQQGVEISSLDLEGTLHLSQDISINQLFINGTEIGPGTYTSEDFPGHITGNGTLTIPGEPWVYDCNGDLSGEAFIDDCGECSGGNTGMQQNATCEQDCNGDWGGEAFYDNCGECTGGETGLEPGELCKPQIENFDNTGIEANAGEPFTIEVHVSGPGTFTYQWYLNDVVIEGATSNNYTVNESSIEDAGTYYVIVTNEYDHTISESIEVTIHPVDCHGTPNGNAYYDNCQECVGGDTNKEACTEDCNGDFGGTAYLDNCETCAGGNTDIEPGFTCSKPVIVNIITEITAEEGEEIILQVISTGPGDNTYQWYLNDEPIEGADGASFTIPSVSLSDAGTYYVIITNDNGQTTSSDINVNIETPTSQIHIAFDKKLKIYPNPTSELMYLQFDISENRDIRIFNSLGIEVLHLKSSKQIELINVSSLPRGVYHLKIEFDAAPIVKSFIVD
ncbi:MAG: right-handed parallel beta-helix repeat-containing protein [Cytophagaceae bacterium]